MGLAATAATVLAGGTVAGAAEAAEPATVSSWDLEADVVCVGSGAAALAAAVTAVDGGAKVILLEKMPILGGTTGKSGGVAWIPNHALLRARGIEDRREDCLRYMARYAFPLVYTPGSPTLGLPEPAFRLLEAFYDNGWRMVDRMQGIGAVGFREFTMWGANRPAPDYADHLPENKLPRGRCLEPGDGGGASLGGAGLVAQMEAWLRARGTSILTEHRVTKLFRDQDRVTGVEVRTGDRTLRIRARQAVVFGTGGFAHNTDLLQRHQPALYGSCATPGATGDFIAIAGEMGAGMGGLGTAWRTQIVLEEALENRAIGLGAFFLPGDSMIVVNKYGRRIVNEKRNYNDRTQVHFIFDPVRVEYPNLLTFMVFDERTLDAFGGAFPLPEDRRETRYLIQGATLEELAANIRTRVETLADRTGGFAIAPDFAATLQGTVTRFNDHARAGRDPDFDRGLHAYDHDWHALFSAMRPGTKFPVNPLPDSTLHPLAPNGPYYALILGPGALDTNGGPMVNEKAQILDQAQKPIPGLYGAGNCIASPSRGAYFGAGGTIGLALTFGYIAGCNAVQEPGKVL